MVHGVYYNDKYIYVYVCVYANLCIYIYILKASICCYFYGFLFKNNIFFAVNK